MQQKITDDLEALLEVLPPTIAQSVREGSREDELLEVVLDLGRRPEARFIHHELQLSQKEVSQGEVDFVVSRISEFDGDNRAGIERTLHRISDLPCGSGRIRDGRHRPGHCGVRQECPITGASRRGQDHPPERGGPHPG
jgi:stage III sporulation protein SpoIIIAA